MSAMEESLRRALANGDAADPAFRETIYAASERALERMVVARAMPQGEADERRARLAETIQRVEAEHAGAPASAAATPGDPTVTAAPVQPDPVAHQAGQAGLAEENARAPGSYAAPGPAPGANDEGEMWRPGAGRPPRRGGRGRGRLILVLAALAILLALILYVASIVFVPSGDTPADPAAGTGAEALSGDAGEGGPPELAWIEIFSGGELESITAPPALRVTAQEGTEGDFVRLSGTAGEPAEAQLAIGPGLIGEIAGQNVRIEIRAGSPDGEVHEFAVGCLFGSESICDRQRFATAMAEEAFVFDVEVPANVETPARLVFDPGLGQGSPEIDLHAVRLRAL